MRWPSKDFHDYLPPAAVRAATLVAPAPRARPGTPPEPILTMGFQTEGLARAAGDDLEALGYRVEIEPGGSLGRHRLLVLAHGHPGIDLGAVDRHFEPWAAERGGRYISLDIP